MPFLRSVVRVGSTNSSMTRPTRSSPAFGTGEQDVLRARPPGVHDVAPPGGLVAPAHALCLSSAPAPPARPPVGPAVAAGAAAPFGGLVNRFFAGSLGGTPGSIKSVRSV